MWINSKNEIINDDAVYVGVNGTTYPAKFHKGEILYPDTHELAGTPQLIQVTLTDPPVSTVYQTVSWSVQDAVQVWQVTDWTVDQVSTFKASTIQMRWDEIKAIRDRRKASGVKVGNNWFNSDDSSRIQQIGLVLMGASMPVGIQWKMMDNNFITMTPTLAGQIFQATAASDMAIFAIAEHHKAAMKAAEDPSSYDFTTGWPLVYGE